MKTKSTRLEAFSLSATAALDGVPEWIHLLPRGKVETVDSRSGFSYDGGPIPLVSIDGRDSVDRVIVDINHATSKRSHLGDAIPAQGWVAELSARDDGLWARVEWTPAGRDAIQSKAYRGVSAEIFVDKQQNRVIGLSAISLTNRPAVRHLVPIFNTANPTPENDDGDDMEKLMLKLCAALKLKDDTSEDALVAAVTQLAADNGRQALQLSALAKAVGAKEDAPYEQIMLTAKAYADTTKMVPVQVVEEMRQELLTSTTRFNELDNKLRQDKATAFVEGEFHKGRIGLVGAMKQHYITRHMLSAESAKSVELEITNMPIMQGSRILPAAPPEDGKVMLTAEEDLVAKVMGIDADAMRKTKAALAA